MAYGIAYDLTIRTPLTTVFAGVSTPLGLNAWWTENCSGIARLGEELKLGFGNKFLLARAGRIVRAEQIDGVQDDGCFGRLERNNRIFCGRVRGKRRNDTALRTQWLGSAVSPFPQVKPLLGDVPAALAHLLRDRRSDTI